MADLTGKNISDTYTRLVQVSESQLYDGAGSSLPITFDGDNVEIAGILTAQTYVVSESVVNTSSGSTIFGNSSDDTHTFTGNITASGEISASGLVKGLGYLIEGNVLADMVNTDILGLGYQNDTKINIGRNDNPTKIVGNITASRNILATGSIHTLSHITSSGNISASGNLIANNATISEGYLTIEGDGVDHGFKLQRDGLDTYRIRHLDGGLTIQNSSDSRKEMTFDGTGKVGIGNSDPQEILTVEGNISSSGNIISPGTGSFGRLEATGDIALQLLNDQAIVFENAAGNEFSQIKMNTNDQLILQNLRSDKDVFIKAGSDGNEGNVIIQKGGSEDTIAKFGKTADLDLAGNFTASGNISANYIATAKIPLIQYISTDATSTAQGRVLASGTHDNATDSFALEWDTPLFEDTDFFETGSVSPTTTGAINTFAVKQTGRYEINCNITFRATAGARPGLNLGIFTSSAVNTVGDFRPKGPAAHAYVRVSGTALGSTAAIPGFVIQLTSGSAVSMKVDLKNDFGATGNTLWSGSLSHFNMKKIG